MSPLGARAAADPALLGGDGLAGGALGAGIHTVAIADYFGSDADTVSWVVRGRGSETVRAGEGAGIPIIIYTAAHGDGVNWVIAVRRRVFNNLN